MKRGIITIDNGVVGISRQGSTTRPTAPVWMMQEEIADMFNVYGRDIRIAINAVYKDGESFESETLRYIRLDEHRSIDVYSIEMIIAIAFRINSKETLALRRYIMNRLYPKNDCNIVLFANGFRKGDSIFN